MELGGAGRPISLARASWNFPSRFGRLCSRAAVPCNIVLSKANAVVRSSMPEG